ncbi:hypothetical protein [Caulobacter sp. UNC279MFTsu5.1]|uniref:hypothetical protein n=1 Tax=Caulobacter sp. UNC279MFTsu5.1 TaxID=1502775 RepID=UPI00037CB575|nr:hypothetical protein [Caulobacter sp. UNC279MFTsu5.1]SFK71710.1 hypothetical protein SAMN02799626_04989 [Caulobacter sp. UNC279MFTsu5.1]
MIDPYSFTWEAFATLFTGLVAVAGAVVIGLRQTQILGRQVALAEMDQRIALFERRFKIYDDANLFLNHMIAFAGFPPKPIEDRFRASALEARLLFPSKVHDDLWAIYKRALQYDVLKKKMAADFARDHQYAADDTDQELIENLWLNETLINLLDVFGDELKLGESPTKASK